MRVAKWGTGLLYGLLTLLFVIVAARIYQDRMVYYPRAYAFAPSAVPTPVRVIAFATSQGAQKSFFVPPRSGPINSLWVFFPGNAGTALEWLDWTNRYPDPSTAFLLIDYPGYGFSEGRPSAEAILETSEKAFAALARALDADPALLWRKTSVLGHSLGVATALQFAARHAPQRIVLVSPFTTLRAIGQRVLGTWVGPLVNNEYDNLARIKELEGRPVVVQIVHGSDDDVISVDFGRELGRRFSWVHYQEIGGAHHNDVFDVGRIEILRSMGQGAPH